MLAVYKYYFPDGEIKFLTQVSRGSQNNMPSVMTTSYQQHSSSAEERKYMQQQLMQFNAQFRESQDKNEHALPQKASRTRSRHQHKSLDQDLLGIDDYRHSQQRSGQRSHNVSRPSEELKIQDDLRNGSSNDSSNASSSSKIANSSKDQDQLGVLQQQRNSQSRSSVRFEDGLFGDKVHETHQMKGSLQWSQLFSNQKLLLLLLSSSILNALTQVFLTLALQQQMNTPTTTADYRTDILSWINKNSYSLIILVISFIHQFIIVPDLKESAQQPEENLPKGIYLIFMTMIAALVAHFVTMIDPWAEKLAIMSFTIMGLRMFIMKTCIQVKRDIARIFESQSLILNLMHLWIEFLVYFVFSCIYSPYIKLQPNQPTQVQAYSSLKYYSQYFITLCYILSLITMNNALVHHSLFSVTNQFLMTTFLAFVYLMTSEYMSLTLIVTIAGVVISVYIIGIVYQSCRAIVIKKISTGIQQKKAMYGQYFQEDNYERLLPTPYVSGIVGNTDMSIHDHSQPQTSRHQGQLPRQCQEYYIVENDLAMLLKKRPCLDEQYKKYSISHFSLRFYAINSVDLSQSLDVKDPKKEERVFRKAIKNYQRRMFS